MPLLTLSNELLLEIASYFKYDSDIYTLMRTSCRLYHLLGTYLYQHNARYCNGSALKWAVRSNDLVGARKAVGAGALRKENRFCNGLLEVVVGSGNAEMVSLLLESGLGPGPESWVWPVSDDSGDEDKEGKGKYEIQRYSCLAIALAHGYEAVVRVLIRHLTTSLEQKDGIARQLNVSENDEMPLQQSHRLGITPSKDGARDLLRSAATRGDLATVKLLKEYIPASSDYKTWPIGVKTPLAQAAMYGKVEVMRYLLSAGLDPNLGCSSSDKTSLYYAARNNQIEAAQLLLDHGACADPHSPQQIEQQITYHLPCD